ncbi:MAG: threonine/serine exporter family protein [Clostridia bacterium]|nr:threonine/serine exporter family protein [Clostridia bacterium]
MPVVQLICAFLGSVVFSMVFNVNRRHLLSAGIGGFLGWAVYLGMGILTGSEFFKTLIAASFIALFAEVMARVKKAPTTVFLTAAAIPLFPGASLYRTMRCAVESDMEGFVQRGLSTLSGAAGIACGILCTMTVWYLTDRIFRRLSAKPAPTYCTDSTNSGK